MAEGGGHKHYDATQTKRERAQREGNSARSNELSGVAAFGAASVAIFVLLGALGQTLVAGFALQLHAPLAAMPLGWMFAVATLALTPPLAAAVAASLVSTAQGGGLRFVAIKLAVDKLSPIAGLKRMLGADAAIAALRAIVAFVVATLAVAPVVRETFLSAGSALDVAAFGELARGSAERAIAAVVIVGLLFAGADYALVKKKWLKDLRMTHDEMKRDTKENDGDPHTRARRKSLHRRLLRGSLSRVREASFVITNPTHIAIAIKYAPPQVSVPEIVVRAADEAAALVRTLARDAGIPLVENVVLARALYAECEAGRPIAREHFVAVAQVIAELSRARALS